MDDRLLMIEKGGRTVLSQSSIVHYQSSVIHATDFAGGITCDIGGIGGPSPRTSPLTIDY